MLYTFLDKTIFMAYNIPHLPLDKLPPLADYDSAKHLVERSYRVRLILNMHPAHLLTCYLPHPVFGPFHSVQATSPLLRVYVSIS